MRIVCVQCSIAHSGLIQLDSEGEEWLKFKAIEDCFHRCLVFFVFCFFLLPSRPLQKGKKSESHQSEVWPEISENQLNLLFS